MIFQLTFALISLLYSLNLFMNLLLLRIFYEHLTRVFIVLNAMTYRSHRSHNTPYKTVKLSGIHEPISDFGL